MHYSILGKTGLKVSCLGFGAMRLPMKEKLVDRTLAIPMIHRAFDAGVNYIDTAVGYCEEDSQRVVGEALQGRPRESIIVSTKNPYFGEDEKAWWTNLENSLERLRTPYIDIYNTHGVNGNSLQKDVIPRISRWLLKARDQGLIRHITTSFHDDNTALRAVIDSGLFESITLQYNILDRKLEDGMAYARSKNVGVVVMGPVGGGRLGAESPALAQAIPNGIRIPELALRFVLSNPNVNIALSGMSTLAQVEDNIRICNEPQPLSPSDIAALDEHLARLRKMADLYCTGCNYCKPCPKGVNIPRVFQLYNEDRVYGFHAHARQSYTNWKAWEKDDDRRADSCVECGLCEPKCPQKIAIREQLKESHKLLSNK